MKKSKKYVLTGILVAVIIILSVQNINKQQEIDAITEDAAFYYSKWVSSNETAMELYYIIEDYENRVFDIHTIASETYNIPRELLIAIETLESGHYTSPLYLTKNNSWGCNRGGEWTTFDSPEHSTMELARTLRHSYFDNGLDTVEEIAKVFCPPTSDEWANSINGLMEDLENGY